MALAVRGDEELNTLLRGHIRDGGVVPHIFKAVAAAVEGDAPPLASEFDAVFVTLLREAPPPAAPLRYSVAVDPRDGLHYALRHVGRAAGDGEETEDDSDGEKAEKEEEEYIFPVPHLDACSALPATLRQAAARGALPARMRDILDAEIARAAADPSLAARERLRRVRREQRRVDTCLDEGAFRGLVLAIGPPGELVWSGEALQALQAAAEAGLLALSSAAAGVAWSGGRAMLRRQDLVAVRRAWAGLV